MFAIIFLNGKLPQIDLIKKFIQKGSIIIAADGGANRLKGINVMPDIIIGDFDSVYPAVLKFFKNKKVELIKESEQETTDFEKSLRYCIKRKLTKIIVFGATSMRPDHTMNNFSILKRFSRKAKIKFITEEYEILMIERKIKFEYRKCEIISLLAMPVASGIRTEGLEFPLHNETLEFGVREGTLNKSVSSRIKISFKKGDLLLFKKHFL